MRTEPQMSGHVHSLGFNSLWLWRFIWFRVQDVGMTPPAAPLAISRLLPGSYPGMPGDPPRPRLRMLSKRWKPQRSMYGTTNKINKILNI